MIHATGKVSGPGLKKLPQRFKICKLLFSPISRGQALRGEERGGLAMTNSSSCVRQPQQMGNHQRPALREQRPTPY
jgi:hypothetical protein